MWIVGSLIVLVVAGLGGLARFNVWATRPVIYDISEPAALEPYLRSWGPWLEERGRIVVRELSSGAEVEFRKRRYRSKPDQLILRIRNADATRPFFPQLQVRFDEAGVRYELERTPRRQHPRAIAVTLEAEDVLTPLVGVRLVNHVLEGLACTTCTLQIWAEWRMREPSDAPQVALIPWQRGRHAGLELGRRLRRLS